MSVNTIDAANQLLSENATLRAEVARLNEQVQALAAESELKSEQNKFLAVENDRLQTIIYKNILPYRQQGFIPGGIDELIAATNRHMDEIKREFGARAIDDLATEFGQIAQTLKPNSVPYRAAKAAVFRCVAAAHRIRAGEVPNV